ncbi:MAG TPA: hypothetical protein QF589_01995, partial [Anaerolineales bacterium]|nr:hypothetical protein [Anaerolineales bacterium]
MPEVRLFDAPVAAPASFSIDRACLQLRREEFGERITFHAPGLRRYATGEYSAQNAHEFAAVSLT